MENLNLVLGIVASLIAILSAVLSVGNTIQIRKMEDRSKHISSGDKSNNIIGNNNKANQ